VPHYVLIPATGAEPIILPSILTQEIVLEALRKVQG
jgi:thiol:disulfide interchange protein